MLLLVPALVLGISILIDIEAQAFPLSDRQREMFDRMMGDDLATDADGMRHRAGRRGDAVPRHGAARLPARYGRAQAIWGSAALFGLAHLNVYQFVAALLLGAVSGWLYERARSLVPSIALHAAYNTALNALANLGLDSGDSTQVTLSAGLWIASSMLAIHRPADSVTCVESPLSVPWLASTLSAVL